MSVTPVQWPVFYLPAGRPDSEIFDTTLDGQYTNFVVLGPRSNVGASQPDTSRWVAFSHPGTLDQKALAYRVNAAVTMPVSTGAGPSVPVVLRQGEKDVLRQEYVDFQIADLMPARTELKAAGDVHSRHFTYAELTGGSDYSVAFLTNGFLSHLDDLRDSTGYALPINSGFRNPVHHRFHIARRPGQPVALRSNHQSGNAADIDVGRELIRWVDVRSEAIKIGMCSEPLLLSTVDHVHVDWRGGRPNCPLGW